MPKEFRCFIQKEKPESFSEINEKRSDLYITFPEIPQHLSKCIGLKFRDVTFGKNDLSANRLELKLLQKNLGNGVEIWQKIRSSKLSKTLFVLEKPEIKESKENLYNFNNTLVKLNKKEVLEQILPFLKPIEDIFDIIGKLGPDPKISLALINKQRTQSRYKSFIYEENFLEFHSISSQISVSKPKFFISYCVEDFVPDSIETLQEFQKIWIELNKKYTIVTKNIKGYPEFILDNL